MNSFGRTLDRLADWPTAQPARRNLASLASDLLPLGDFLCLVMVASVGSALYGHGLFRSGMAPTFENDLGLASTFAAVLAPFILYDRRFGRFASRREWPVLLRSHLFRFASFLVVLLVLGMLGDIWDHIPARWLSICALVGLASTSLTRLLMARHVQRWQSRGMLTDVVAVIGAGPLAMRLMSALREAGPDSVECLGIFDDGATTDSNTGGIAATGTVAELIALAHRRPIDWIVLALPAEHGDQLAPTVERLKGLSASIGVCPQHIGLAASPRSTGYVGALLPVNLMCDRPIKRWDAVVKAAEDLLLGGLLTLALLPVLALIALAIKLNSPGPVLFRQRRHAMNNREFDIYKFRTMRWEPPGVDEALHQTTRNDERITPLGRFLRATSLDELPQLFNVLQGHMSLVGPRPHATNMRTEDRLGSEITDCYAHRHRVKPGITGWAQVNGARGATETEAQLRHRVALDLHYIDNWSLLLDLKILALTAAVVLKRTNAF